MIQTTDNGNDNNLLWTNESVFCWCSHHVENHKTTHPLLDVFCQSITMTFCDFDKCGCKCKGFKAYKMGDGNGIPEPTMFLP